MKECIALKRSKINKEQIFYFVQPSTIVPVNFKNHKIDQDGNGLFVFHEVLSDRKIWNTKTIGVHCIMACYIDNPNCLVFKSTNKYEIEDPAFQCFAQVTPKTYDQVPATNDEENKETLKHEQDEFAIQQFTDNINMGLGSY